MITFCKVTCGMCGKNGMCEYTDLDGVHTFPREISMQLPINLKCILESGLNSFNLWKLSDSITFSLSFFRLPINSSAFK